MSTSLSNFAAPVTQVKVEASTANGGNATLSATAGTETLISEQKLTTTSTEYVSEIVAGVSEGDLVITLSNSAPKAVYIKSITVVF